MSKTPTKPTPLPSPRPAPAVAATPAPVAKAPPTLAAPKPIVPAKPAVATETSAKPAVPKQPEPMKVMSDQELKKLPVGASSHVALEKATGGKIERIGKMQVRNTFALNIKDKRFVYVRAQDQGGGRSTAYGTSTVKKTLDPEGRMVGKQFDHVASTEIEGGRIGMRYVLAAFVNAKVNHSHGTSNEKGPAPVRSAAKAFPGGIDRKGEHHVNYMTQEMANKLAGKASLGRGHSTLRGTLSLEERREMSKALMQSSTQQELLRRLTRNSPSLPGENRKTMQIGLKSQTKGMRR